MPFPPILSREKQWINSRPTDETWKVMESGILSNDLGPAEFVYHERTLLYIRRMTGLTIMSKSAIPPLLMAPFEILANSDDSYVYDAVLSRLPSGPNPDEVRNLTHEIACLLWRKNYELPSDDRDCSDEELFVNLVLGALREVTEEEVGDVSQKPPTIEQLCFGFSKPQGPHVSEREQKLAMDNFREYRELFSAWPCRFKEELLRCLYSSSGSFKVVKMNPDLSAVLLRLHCAHSHTFGFLHSGRGIGINSFRNPSLNAHKRVLLRYRRDSWEVKSPTRTAAAWIWVFISLGAAGYRVQENWKEGVFEAFIRGFEILSILTIAVFGFVKLWVHDESILFRLMTGYRPLNSRHDMLRYLSGRSDPDEGEAELSRDISALGEEQFSDVKAGAQRSLPKTGTLRLGGLKDEYLGRAGYIGFGTILIDCVKDEVIKSLHLGYGLGIGKFARRASLTPENVEQFLEDSSTINNSAERELVTRRMVRYI